MNSSDIAPPTQQLPAQQLPVQRPSQQMSLRRALGYVAGICAILSLPGGLWLLGLAAGWLAVVLVVFGFAMLLQFPLLFLVKLWITEQAEWEAANPHSLEAQSSKSPPPKVGIQRDEKLPR